MFVGSGGSKILFGEPMLTKAYLETLPDVTLDVKQPAEFQKPGYSTTKYRISYDKQQKIYTVLLEG